MALAHSTQVKAAKQLDASKKIRQDALDKSMATYNELNKSLESKVQFTHRIIDKLDHRTKSMEGCITGLKQSHGHLLEAIKAKDQPLSLCSWRREQREKRPLRENVRDSVEAALEAEKSVLIDAQRKLND